MTYDAIVLAGGSSRRMGGGDKTALPVDGVALLDRVLGALTDAGTRIVVGDPRPTALPETLPVTWTREDPAGGGPAAAIAAGVRFVTEPLVVVLAGDLPFLDPDSVATLLAAAAASDLDGVLASDATGAPQWLCGVWRTSSLRRLLAAQPVEGLALRRLFAISSYDMISLAGRAGREPWFDCDTPQDLARAKEKP